MNTIVNIGTGVTVACFVLSFLWFGYYTATATWWGNRGGRLMVLMSLWQTTGFGLMMWASLNGDSVILDRLGHNIGGALERLSFVSLVLGALIYQWYVLLIERKEGRDAHVAVSESGGGHARGDCCMGHDSGV